MVFVSENGVGFIIACALFWAAKCTFNRCFGKNPVHFNPFCVAAILDRDYDTGHAFGSDGIVRVWKGHWDNEVDRRETSLADICILSVPADVKPLLLVWNTRVILVDQCPVSEIDICSIETGPLSSCMEMLFQLFEHITVQQGSEKILFITTIR
jgi:hypothetical protein